MIDIVLPKGSLEPQALKLFEEADLPVVRASSSDFNATIPDPRIGRVKILRPQEIGKYVEQGFFDLGITGKDWIEETQSHVTEVLDLGGSGRQTGSAIKIVLAVLNASGIASPREIKPGARVATEYTGLTRRYFERLEIPVEIYLSYGATEAKVPDIADAIVEATETGSTLRRNGMKIIDIVLESTTKLIAHERSWNDTSKRQEIEEIAVLLRGVLTGRGKVLLKMNVPEERLDDIIGVLPAMKTPTVSRLFGSGYYAIETVAVKTTVNLLIPELKKRGAEAILEIPISKIVD